MSNSYPLETGYGGSWYRRGPVLASYFYDDSEPGDGFAIQFWCGSVQVKYAYLKDSDDWSDFNAAMTRAKKLSELYRGHQDELVELRKNWARPLLGDPNRKPQTANKFYNHE